MAQFARPSADTTLGNYTDEGGGTTDIFNSINESSANDADYITSPTSPVNEVYACALTTVTDPESSSGHIMRTDLERWLRRDYKWLKFGLWTPHNVWQKLRVLVRREWL